MNRYETVRYEMFLRVRNYGVAQRDRFPEASPAGQAFATVSQAVADIEAQTTARLTAAADARKAKSRTQMDLRAKMKAIARTARGLALTDEAWVKRLQMPTRRTDKALLDSARFFLQEAEPHTERLALMGLPATVLADVRALVDALETTKDQRRTGAQRR